MRRAALAVVAALATSACASIMHGSSQPVSFGSTPTGATVYVNNQQMGVTPVTLDLRRKDSHTVRIVMPGYQPHELQLTRGTSGWVWGNLVFGGIPGLAIDAITGALYQINPDNVMATLQPQMALLEGRLHIAIVMAPMVGWEKVGQLERAGL